MKKTLLLIAALYGLIAYATDPVAVWNGDFSTTVKGDYTLSANGNTVAADGSSITIAAAKGISIAKTAGGNIGDQASTVIIKYTDFTPPTGSDAQVLVMNHTANTSYKDFIGAASVSGGNIHGIWQNTTWGSNKTATGAYGSAQTDTKTFAFAWAQTGTVGAYFWMDGANKNGWSGLHGNLQVDSVWVGGPNESTTLKPATGMKVLAIAVFDSRISDDEIASYTFPEPAKKVEPVMLVNFGYTTAEQGWYNYTQNRGNTIPSSGTLTTNDVSFTATNTIGNFFNSTDGEFDEVTSDWEEGTYEDIFGNSFTTVADELRSSLGVADLPFSANVYKSALMNGGYSEHQVTISGLDGSAKYVVYTGFGMRRTNYPSQVMGVQFDSSGYASVEALDYIATVAGMATTKANRYQSFTAGTQLRPGSEGLLLTRLTNVQPKADGTIAFTFKGDKGGINFLAVAKVNETTVYTTKEIAGGATISVSAINAEIEETNDKAEVTLDPGAVVTYDAALKVPTKFISSGSITLTHETQPDLAKADFSGVTGAVKRDWVKKGFGFNFNNNAGGTTTVALETTTWKSDASGNNGTNVAMSEDSISKITWTSNNVYTDQQNTGTILHGYLDDSAGVNITVSNIPFAEYAVIIYSTTDTENAKLSYKTVNGKDYTADGTKDVAKEGTEAWGRSRSSAEAAYGTNALRIVAQTSGSLVIHSANRSGARGCISAIQIVPYTTKVKPSIETDFELVAVEATAEDYTSGTVTLDISGVKENDCSITYTAVVNGSETPITGMVDKKQGSVSFNLDSLVPGTVYRGTITLTYDDGKVLATTPIAVHAGEQKYIWTTEGELWVNETATTIGTTGVWTDGIAVSGEKLVVNTASGVTFTPKANPDYVEKCDSTFTVSISASEAVDAASDPAPTADVQGGVRIASVGGVLKVQALADGVWADLKSSDVDIGKDYEVVVAFHYAKDGVEDDADSVSYTLDGVTVTGGKVANTVAKISSVEVADGTSLAFLKGICELDKAVVVDVEVEIGHGETAEITAADEKAAQEIADKMVIAIASEIAEKLTAAQQESYRGYFKVQVTQAGEGKFSAAVVFKADVEKAIEDELEKSMEKVVGAFNTIEGKAEIAAKPGLYYGVKRGASPDKLEVEETTLATSEKVTITITKPEGAAAHFYRIICSPTPNH